MQQLIAQASLAAEIAGVKNGDNPFLALFRKDRKVDLAILNVKYRTRSAALRVDNVIRFVFAYGHAAMFGVKGVGIER